MEKKDIEEISYLILQHKYLEKLGLNQNDNQKLNYSNIFPDGWFSISLESRINIINDALKNDCSLEVSLQKHNLKLYEKK